MPMDLAVGGVDARQNAGDAEGVDLAIGDARDAARAVAEGDLGLVARIGSIPNRLAGAGIEGGKRFLVLARRAVEEIRLAARDDGAAMRFADGLLPEDLERLLPRLDDLGGTAVALGA